MRDLFDVATFLLAAGLLCGAAPLAAEDGNPNDSPVRFTLSAGGIVTLSGDANAAVTPTAFVESDGPLPLGRSVPARVYARLGISTEPGQTVNLAQVETFKAAEVALGAYRILGSRAYTDPDQAIRVSVAGEWGFASRLPGDPKPAERLSRHYGIGVRLDEVKSGASLSVLYGRDEAAGARGFGQWIVFGQIPVVGEDALVMLVGDATLSVGKARDGIEQRDILRLGISVDLGNVFDRLRAKP